MQPQEFLKERNMKVTKGRVEILKILSNAQKSLCAENIYEIFKKNNQNINLSTIYRTLELFEQKEILDKVVFVDGVFSYKLRKNKHMHHLQCDICKKELEIPCPITQIEEIVQKETGFTLTDHNLVLKGVCKECKKKRSEYK